MKFEQYYEQIDKPETEKFRGTAHGSIQWKGTDVCIDVRCKCGEHYHCDAEFFWNFECPACHRQYAVGTCVSLIELTSEQAEYWKDSGFHVGDI